MAARLQRVEGHLNLALPFRTCDAALLAELANLLPQLVLQVDDHLLERGAVPVTHGVREQEEVVRTGARTIRLVVRAQHLEC